MTKTNITAKQFEILLLLYRFRFLDRSHIQRFLHHKNHRRIISWLNDLTNKKIVGKHYSTKLKENTKPSIYYLATASRKLLTDHPSTTEKLLKRVYREKFRSKRLQDHCLLTADIYFLLLEQSQKETSKLHFYTQVDLATHYYLPYKRPDAYIALETPKETKRYFLILFDEGTPRYMIRSRLSSLVEYFEENTWTKATSHPNPTILIVAPNQLIHDFLLSYIPQLHDEAEVELNFYITTIESRESLLTLEWVSTQE